MPPEALGSSVVHYSMKEAKEVAKRTKTPVRASNGFIIEYKGTTDFGLKEEIDCYFIRSEYLTAYI